MPGGKPGIRTLAEGYTGLAGSIGIHNVYFAVVIIAIAFGIEHDLGTVG